ncbi:GTP-binding protein [Halostagnicola sp. A-GB9-2]|uniref:CobW family GTP-binding protein n=1 Tax=Halostagnicola sp. A-GB9-2 TaxID=3048066 RepID=UPI0024BF158D|nr:GTP-binding protein [Halostagnicola sp. A-GB9-2]MDJ1434122.1 GTP-binding protein [Halostagnicola sp. A-GB9-2]
MNRTETIPVTVVSGYLGAGKTTLVNRVLSNPEGRQIAVIVNDVGEVNVDAELIARANEDDGIIELTNGCICCRLQGDLRDEATRLAENREIDALVVESSGISEPIPVARVFTGGGKTDSRDPSDSSDPPDPFRLDTMVTVLDTYGFWKEFDAEDRLSEDATSTPERPLSEVFVEGIEFCDVLLLNKADMLPDDTLEELEAVVEELQPRAERVRTTYCDIDPELVLETDRFDFEEAKRSQGWKRHLRKAGRDPDHDSQSDHERSHSHDHEEHGHQQDDDHQHDHVTPSAAERHGISTFVFRSDRPFHPERLAAWLEEWDGAIVRAKGVCFVAGYEEVIGVSQAGPSVQAGPLGNWRPDDERRTQLVFIGREMNEARIREELEDCLLEDAAKFDAADGAESDAPDTAESNADIVPDPFPLE